MKPSLIVIFGITGDLAQRKLLPALNALHENGQLHEDSLIVGVSRRAVSAADVTVKLEIANRQWLQKAIRMEQMDLDDAAAYQTLEITLGGFGIDERLYYLSVPPESYQAIIGHLGETATTGKLLIEKPFGSDLASARKLLAGIAEHFPEERVFRVDHYVAKPQLARFLEFWSRQDIRPVSQIRITAFEKLTIEGRAVFYDQVGALRDLIQSHLLQVLGLVLAPADGGRVQALRQIKAADPSRAIRGQYAGYVQAVDNPGTGTETYAELNLTSSDPRWSGTAISLRTGKAMDRKTTEIIIGFKDGGQLTADLAGDGNISLSGGSDGLSLATFDKEQPPLGGAPDGYQNVFAAAIAGDHTIFTTSDEILEAWRIVEPVLEVWQGSTVGLKTYPQGSASVT